MQLEEMTSVWARSAARLERSLAIDERILRSLVMREVRLALAPYVLFRALEVLLGVVALAWIAPVVFAHWVEPRYLIAGGLLIVCAAGTTAQSSTLLVRTLQLDLAGPVARIQAEIGRLQMAEYRSLKWALLGGILVWLPGLLVLFEALTGVPALQRVELPFLVGNLAVGIVVLLIAQLAARRWVERAPRGHRGGRLIEALSGRGLRKTADHLAELAGFQDEASR